MSALFVVGCSIGNDPPVDPNGRTCAATLSITGSFAADASAPAPMGYVGCWPAGTWTFQAAIVMNDCATPPVLEPSYSFQAIRQWSCLGDEKTDCTQDSDCAALSPNTCDLTAPIVDKFVLLAPDPAQFRNIVSVSELGNGMCEGEVDLYSADGKQVWSFRPDLTMAVGTALTGQGEFNVFSTDQYPVLGP